MTAGVITLNQVAARLPAVEVACNRCDRRGKLHTARLLAQHGPAMPVPALLRLIAADCPRMQARRMHDVCGVNLPELSAVLTFKVGSSDHVFGTVSPTQRGRAWRRSSSPDWAPDTPAP